MFGHLGIDLDIIQTTRFEAAFLHVCPDVHRELSCEIVPAHTIYSGADVHALGTEELVADLATREAQKLGSHPRVYLCRFLAQRRPGACSRGLP